MSTPSLSPEQLRMLLQFAANRIGTTPEALACTLRDGGLSGLTQSLSPADNQLLSALIGDRSRAEAFLRSPEVYALLERLSGKGGV